jgi:hypothetical protein
MSLAKKRKPRFQRVPSARLQLQERDAEIILQIYKHRFLTSEHIIALLSASPKPLLRRLCLLYHAGYLGRPKEQIQPYFRGTSPIVYSLGNKGLDLLAQHFHIPRPKVECTSKDRELKRPFLEHTLMVSHFMVCLELACRYVRGIRLIEPHEILRGVPVNSSIRNKPFAWKVKVNRAWRGSNRQFAYSIIPDKVFGLGIGQDELYFFLEADRATMPVLSTNLYRSSIFKKLVGYWQSRGAGLFTRNFGFKAARVLTVTKSQERIDSMIAACQQVDERRKGSKMFLFTRDQNITLTKPTVIFDAIWQSGRDGELTSLLD